MFGEFLPETPLQRVVKACTPSRNMWRTCMRNSLEALLGCTLKHLLKEGRWEAQFAGIQAHSLDVLLEWQGLQPRDVVLKCTLDESCPASRPKDS